MKEKNIKAIIITEDEPFHLAEALGYFFSSKPKGYDFTLAVVLDYFHTHSKISNRIKFQDVLKIFGPFVFVRAVWRLLMGRLNKSKRVTFVLNLQGVPVKTGVQNINSNTVLAAIQKHKPDMLIAIGVNSLFTKPLRDLAPLGCINVHTGIRPEHRGRASMFWALADGHDETGITVHYIDDGIDSGRIITKYSYKIKDRSLDRLSRDLRFLSMDGLIEALKMIRDGKLNEHHHEALHTVSYRTLPNLEDMKIFAKRGNKIF